MKKLFVFLFALMSAIAMSAQDVIVKKDGTTVLANVTKVGETEIEYKKFNSQSERLYTISVANVVSINYQDGEVEKFADVKAPVEKQDPNIPAITPATPTVDNARAIAVYNKPIDVIAQKKSGAAKVAIMTLGVAEQSVLSTDELEVSFISTEDERIYCEPNSTMSLYGHPVGPFQINLKNKTDNIIYVDLGSTFRTSSNGESYTYFKTDVVTSSTGTHSGGAFNLGGITGALGIGGALGSLAGATTLAGGSTSTVSVTHQMQRVLAIPPHGNKILSATKIECAKGLKCRAVSLSEPLPGMYLRNDASLVYTIVHTEMVREPLLQGAHVEYTLEDTPFTTNYQITYTSDPNFMQMKTMNFVTYLKDVVGLGSTYPVKETTAGAKKANDKCWYEFVSSDRKDYIHHIVWSMNQIGKKKVKDNAEQSAKRK